MQRLENNLNKYRKMQLTSDRFRTHGIQRSTLEAKDKALTKNEFKQ